MVVTILYGIAKCPHCGAYRFANPEPPRPDTQIVCLSCGYIPTIRQAMEAWLAEPCSSGAENTIDKRQQN
jgi:hypothetical protein